MNGTASHMHVPAWLTARHIPEAVEDGISAITAEAVPVHRAGNRI